MSEYNNFIESDEWKSKRESILKERGLVCEKCGKEKKKYQLQIHHKNYDKEFGKENNDDLMVTCKNCHDELHQDLEFFDNESLKDICPQCNKKMRKIGDKSYKCLTCGTGVVLK